MCYRQQCPPLTEGAEPRTVRYPRDGTVALKHAVRKNICQEGEQTFPHENIRDVEVVGVWKTGPAI